MRKVLVAAAAALWAAAAGAADLSGTWGIDSSVGDTAVTIHCTIVQSGAALAGNCRPQVDGIPPTELTGTADGANAKWGYDVVFNGNPGRVDYEATVGADGTMTGTMFLSGNPTAFTAARL